MIQVCLLLVGFISGTYANDSLYNYINMITTNEFVALFALAILSVVMLYILSHQITNIKDMYKKMSQRQRRIEEKQATVLAQMSERIQCMTQDVIDGKKDINGDISSEGSKEELLDITSDMIEFLKIKSKKVEITNEEFNLNNVLNEVSGRIGHKYLGSKLEIVFDIENDIPRYLIGDSLHLGTIIYDILEYGIEYLVDNELILHISKKVQKDDKVELSLEFINFGREVTKEELEMFFVPQYNETTQEYSGLGMFIAYELVQLMGGKLDSSYTKQAGVKFNITLPFKLKQPEDLRKYHLPDKLMINKKILIIEDNEQSAKALQKMFSYFRNDIDVMSGNKFSSTKPEFSNYDIVLMDENQFNYRVVGCLYGLKSKRELKVVLLNSLFNINNITYDDNVVDAVLLKPVNQERIFELIVTLYDLDDIESESKSKIPTYTENIRGLPNVTQDSFKDFNGYSMLIVEDNRVNSRVLVSLLEPAGIDTTVANNGKEAIEILQKEASDKFDLIIMDINMPVMDGFMATKTIRYDSKFDHIPIVALTALVLDSEKQKMFSSGMNAYLSKPLNISKLYAAFRLFLNPKTKEDSNEPIIEKILELDDDVLNIKSGISNSNDSRLLYMELLNEFVEAYSKSSEVFETLVKEHRYEQLKMMSLDIRGISATIGAYSMNRQIETIVKDIVFKKFDNVEKAVDIYKVELDKLLHSIESYKKIAQNR